MPRGRWGIRKPILLGSSCTKCGTILNESNCVINGTRIRGICKNCRKSQLAVKQREYEVKQFGISSEEYEKKLEMQLGGCAICKLPCSDGRRLAIDHNHKTSVVRDLLCRRCNTVLGLVNEDEDLIWDMLEYLKRTTWSKTG